MRACDHVCDTTTRYDRALGRLSFVLVCAECRTERVLETVDYAPRYQPFRRAA